MDTKKIIDKLPPEVATEIIQFSNEIHPGYKDRLMSIYTLLIMSVYEIDRDIVEGSGWNYTSNDLPLEATLLVMEYDGNYLLGKYEDETFFNYPFEQVVRRPVRWRYILL